MDLKISIEDFLKGERGVFLPLQIQQEWNHLNVGMDDLATGEVIML
jgi:hypothetical protein